PRLGEELQRSHDDDGTRSVFKLSTREDANEILLHGSEAVRSAKTILKFDATIPARIYGTIREIRASQATYIPEDDRKSPEHGGWLLRGAHINIPIEDEA